MYPCRQYLTCDLGPCYRCIHPVPPPPETVSNCSDNGVIGAITGVIGSLQALQILQLIVDTKSTSLSGKLCVFDGQDTTFMKISLRGRKKDCVVCGTTPSITTLVDYVEFCGSGPHDKVSLIFETI